MNFKWENFNNENAIEKFWISDYYETNNFLDQKHKMPLEIGETKSSFSKAGCIQNSKFKI